MREPTNAWPLDMVDPAFARDLAEEFPAVLLLYHPVYRCWQVWTTGRRSDWDAERLAHAVMAYHVHADSPDWEDTFFWTWRGAPEIFEDNLPPPGEWLLQWLRDANVPPHVFLRQHHAARRLRWERRRRELHDFHRAVASDAYRHVRDIVRGDPLGGKRRWVASVGIDLKGGKAVRTRELAAAEGAEA